MARRKQQAEEAQVYQQEEDPARPGRIRLDRPLTSEEAQAQDAANAQALEEGRAARFAGRRSRT